VGDETWLNYKL